MGNYHIDIGKQLKGLRLKQNKELKDIAKDTKVSESYLEAIEAGRVEEFPSTVYYNLFARSYARELGQDPDSIFMMTNAESIELERVDALGPEATEEEIKSLETNETNNNNSVVKAGVWIAVAIIVIFIVIIYFINSGDKTEKPAVEHSTIEESSNMVAENTPDVVADSTETADETETMAAPPPEPVGPEMKLRVDVIDLSWLLVMADGDTVLNRNLDSGSYRTIYANEQFLISAGNPNGLIIKLNDSLLKPLSPTGRPVRDVEITNLNKEIYYQVIEETNSEGSNVGQF